MVRSIANVLSIPELLEGVLFELPPRDLLLAQLVNKSFRHQITSSKRIQQKLFLTADHSVPPKEENALNPFLGHILRRMVRRSDIYIVRARSDGDSSFDDNHEVLGDYSCGHDQRRLKDAEHTWVVAYCEDQPALEQGSALASWRKMFIARRPATVQVYYIDDAGMDDRDITVEGTIFAETISHLVDGLAATITVPHRP